MYKVKEYYVGGENKPQKTYREVEEELDFMEKQGWQFIQAVFYGDATLRVAIFRKVG